MERSAVAGSRPSVQPGQSAPPGHPRVRGEHRRHAGSLRGDHPAYAGSTSRTVALRACSSDHPRVRGEHCGRCATPGLPGGPSPRTRGALVAVASHLGCLEDHPRVRGEHPKSSAFSSCTGTIPAYAGALQPINPTGHPHGTIPAYAGSTLGSGPRSWPTRDHPACAGSTRRRQLLRTPNTDHPRVRGEHARSRSLVGAAIGPSPVRGEHRERMTWLTTRLGPSPRARGAPVTMVGVLHPIRTIPACAGSTPASGGCGAGTADHPRVRGEHRVPQQRVKRHRGPSPRTRGAPEVVGVISSCTGTIPACAGSTQPTWCRCFLRRDHPRVRGEHRFSRRWSK